MRADEAEQTSQSVERLDEAGDNRRVAAVSRKDLAHEDFEAAEELLRLLPFLIGHIPLPR
jgi:hypothetical protein